DDDPLACVPVFDEGEVREIGFAAECVNPGNCFAGSQLVVGKGVDNGVGSVAEPIILAGDNGGSGIAVAEANFTPLALTFETQPSGDLGAEIVLNYGDAGAIQLHANFNIPLDDAAGGLQSGDFMYGEGSAAFVVRPFGFDVDFPNDRRAEADYTDAQSYAADH